MKWEGFLAVGLGFLICATNAQTEEKKSKETKSPPGAAEESSKIDLTLLENKIGYRLGPDLLDPAPDELDRGAPFWRARIPMNSLDRREKFNDCNYCYRQGLSLTQDYGSRRTSTLGSLVDAGSLRPQSRPSPDGHI